MLLEVKEFVSVKNKLINSFNFIEFIKEKTVLDLALKINNDKNIKYRFI